MGGEVNLGMTRKGVRQKAEHGWAADQKEANSQTGQPSMKWPDTKSFDSTDLIDSTLL